MDTLLLTTGGLLLLFLGPVLLFVSLYWFLRSDRLTERLQEYISRPVGVAKPRGRRFNAPARNLTGSLVTRAILPWFRWIGRSLGRLTPVASIESLSRKLTIAGNPYGLRAREFYGIKVAFGILAVLFAFIALSRGLEMMNLALALLGLLVLLLLPQTWLDRRVRQRQNQVRKDLPDALDMLTVCVSAGLGFDQALQRVNEHWDTPISAEFGRVLTEIEMGLSRREALRNMVNRLDVPEVSSFVSFVLQTEQLGMSISETLHSQADQMRVMRRMRAQEQAQKAPTKMIIPMVFLIFPALLAMVLGPGLPVLIDLFGGF
jgi:tight adherence protein C